MTRKNTLEDIIGLYKKTFHTEDDAAIALVAAVLTGSRLNVPPTWVHIIGPTSGGKSTLLEAFSAIDFVTQVSDITPNTFLSGMSAAGGGETSLLLRLGPEFTIFMKDFTTILSKSDETQEAIISQMREIYDGSIVKITGNGKDISWPGDGGKGHATFVMAVTEAVFSMQDKFSDMGTRAINYVLKPQHRKDTLRRALRNNGKLAGDMLMIQSEFKEFVDRMMATLPSELSYIDEELENDIIDVGDFSSLCRSVIKRDYKGVKSLALSAEMPMRMGKQLLVLAQLFAHINGGTLAPYLREAVFKTGFDSIPKQRRLILEMAAKYERVTVGGMSDSINYPPERCKEWLEDLQMFGIVDRRRSGTRVFWSVREEYRSVLSRHLGIRRIDGTLEGEDEGGEPNWQGGVPGNYQDIPYESAEMAQAEDSDLNQRMNDLARELSASAA